MTFKELRFTQEEIDKANSIDIINYAVNVGLDPKRVGANSYHIKGYGGLYINPSSNEWNCFSQNKGGGPIQFIMFIEDKTWVEAVKTSLKDEYKRAINSNKIKAKEEERGDFILPKKNNTYKHIIAYLIQTREIDKDIVYKLIKDRKLYEDKKRNCVFVGYDRRDISRYANIRSTKPKSAFKGEVRNSDKSYSFSIKGVSEKVYVFESPIEILSYLTIMKLYDNDPKHHMVSLGGVTDKALARYLKDNMDIKDIVCCLNNDKAGIESTEKIKSKYKEKHNIIEKFPANKDYNEDLINIKNLLKEKDLPLKIPYKEDIQEEELSLER